MALGYEKPNDDLLAELESVAEDARALVEYLKAPNTLPNDFPQEALIAIGQSLISLPEGTAEGCRRTLEYASNRLPAIRRQNFQKEDPVSGPTQENEEPPLVRGMSLDQLVSDLYASVGTALDEYRDQVREHFDDTVQAEPTGLVDDVSASEAIATSRKLEDEVTATVADISANAIAGSRNIDRLTRRLSDATSLMRAVRAELHLKHIMLRWYRQLTDGVKALPKLIGAAGGAIRIGVDVARPLGEWWVETERRLLDLAFDEVYRFGETLRSIGANLDGSREAGNLDLVEDERDPTTAYLEREARRLMLAGEAPPADMALLVERLDLTGEPGKKKSIIPKSQLILLYSNLRELDIRRTSMTGSYDFNLIAGLKTLTRLKVRIGKDTQCDAIAALTGLTHLVLIGHNVRSIEVLGWLTNLTHFEFSGGRITFVDALARLKNLRSLTLQTPGLLNIEPLRVLEFLEQLTIGGKQRIDLEPLRHLTHLKYLDVRNIKVSDWSPVEHVPEVLGR